MNNCSSSYMLTTMKQRAVRGPARRLPKQRRALQTVDAVLDAVIRILKREGLDAVTTNRIAEVAGVSIGSLYQYFPDKRAIFEALHRRHIEQIDHTVAKTLVQHGASPLDELITAMIEAMVEAHETDPELHHLLMAEVPHGASGKQEFAVRLHGTFLLAIAARSNELKKHRDPVKTAFIVAHMVEALSHGAVQRRPPGLSRADAKKEAIRAVLAYLHA
jgi:AcrR family transcriptional regulator